MHLTREVIPTENFLKGSDGFESGANVLFLGVCRDHSGGRRVLHLEYEADETVAEKMLSQLVESAAAQWPVNFVGLKHRLGVVRLGEIALFCSVWSAHRDEAYKASRYLIEEIKHRVPIWKKENFEDGTHQWSLCPAHVELS